MRLDKFVANNSSFSRSQVRTLIKARRLAVNGTTPSSPATKLTETDQVTLDGSVLQAQSAVYLMLNKPLGYVCANQDSEHPTVIDLVTSQQLMAPNLVSDLQIVGRLDIDTTGLVLLTTDGHWNHRVSSPNSVCGKRYRVECAEPISDTDLATLEAGILLRNESRKTRPANIQRLSPTSAEITIYEGMYHQVKRMFAATGNKVIALHRLAIGAINLDKSLEEGSARMLSDSEIHGFN
ncbi:16S rRNA pseudouridine516 synthase [Alteromonadaceae bacterium 2753L.S.0a.02]|nr:16S rRNA pseudouridine516 synthase [Alteromonadaceae bacterium 2753L.S.0a.02]